MATRNESYPTPPFDAELADWLASNPTLPTTILPEHIIPMREERFGASPSIDELIGERSLRHEEHVIEGPSHCPDIVVSVFTRIDHIAGGPGIFHTHGGGMIAGNRFSGAEEYFQWVEVLDAVVVSVEYRLAPEHPDPAPVDDCYAGLLWTATHAAQLGFDPGRLVIAGASAGGGLAAGLILKARDQGGPQLAGSLLIYPMLDDRNDSISSYQIDGVGRWDRGSNDTGWDALLGTRRNTDEVSYYAAPARAPDLTNLPPTFIDVASTEVFRDEDVAYAMRIWEQGGVAELHVWPGGFHGFDGAMPEARLSRLARAARVTWLRGIFGAPES